VERTRLSYRRGAAKLRATALRRVASLVAISLLGAACAGCATGDAARPGEGIAPRGVAPPEAEPAVGPAPLRRLSNDEYRNALRDLFPAVDVALPPLPADIAVAGFENAAEAQEPSDVRIARYEAIANLYAEAATIDAAAVTALVGCADWSTPEHATSCAAQFVGVTGGRVFRRPLTDAERDRFMQRFQEWRSAVDFEGAVRLTLSAMLQSPQFLYRVEPPPRSQPAGSVVPVDAYAMASRLSFFLWESVPDDALLQAALRDELRTDDQVRDQVDRMLRDARARRALWSFHRQWLALDRVLGDEHAVRTPEVDAAWGPTSQASATEESQRFVQNVLAQGGTFHDLMVSRRAWVNGEMARIYGLAAPKDPSAWTEVVLPGAERAGLVTRAAFLAGFSHRGATSPPVRGNGIELRLLCQLPVSPPPGADLSQPKPAPDQGPQTNRMLFEARTKPAACQACHAALNGFGFGLENYDAAGHYRSSEDGLPIDASGSIQGTDVDGPFVGGIELSSALGRSEVVHRCAVERWVRYALGRAPVVAELPTVASLTDAFTKSDGDVRALLRGIATSPTFRMRRVGEE